LTSPRMQSALIAARAAQARIDRKRRREQIERDWKDSPVGDLSKVTIGRKARVILRPVY